MLQGTSPIDSEPTVASELAQRFGANLIQEQSTEDGIPTIWTDSTHLLQVLRFLKIESTDPYRMLYDLTALDERTRTHRDAQPRSDFTVVYHLLSFGRNQDARIKVPLVGEAPCIPSVTSLWPNANWYEREVWDMFGVTFNGHPHLTRNLDTTKLDRSSFAQRSLRPRDRDGHLRSH